jgi:uncharacterized damage-inducible protein DinB
MTLGRLSVHVATLARFAERAFGADFFDMGAMKYDPPEIKTSAELVQTFEDISAKARVLLEKTSDEKLADPWEFRVKGEVRMTMPRVAAYRKFYMSHLIHHRAQLGVYLRLNGVAIPGSYGPSADEKI